MHGSVCRELSVIMHCLDFPRKCPYIRRVLVRVVEWEFYPPIFKPGRQGLGEGIGRLPEFKQCAQSHTTQFSMLPLPLPNAHPPRLPFWTLLLVSIEQQGGKDSLFSFCPSSLGCEMHSQNKTFHRAFFIS